jgi:hypothetical protein
LPVNTWPISSVSMFRTSVASLGKGGVFSARVHPRIKQILRGVKQESNLRREAITRFNKRWRSWAIRTVRKHNLARQVVLTADPTLMDAEYLATCMQKAASQGLKDAELWKGYIDRFVEISSQVPPQYFGYMVWAIGRVQIPYKEKSLLHEKIIERGIQLAPELSGGSLMAVLWTLRRALVKPPPQLLEKISNETINRVAEIRPSDFIKILNNLAFFGYGKTSKPFRDKLSQIALRKFENETFAQDFRCAMDPLALANLYNDELRSYILDRFRKIFITARPAHLMHAYHASVLVRVLAPEAWFNLVSEKTRGFYQSLAVRHIPVRSRGIGKMHQQVSDTLAGSELQIPHRNMFRWGPFWIDIGIETPEAEIDDSSKLPDDDRKTCLIIDKPSSFYVNAKTILTEKSQLEDVLLSSVGWNVVHVNHYRWKKCINDEARVQLLRSLLP